MSKPLWTILFWPIQTNADWRAVIRAFEQAMAESMREGGELFKEFGPYDGAR